MQDCIRDWVDCAVLPQIDEQSLMLFPRFIVPINLSSFRSRRGGGRDSSRSQKRIPYAPISRRGFHVVEALDYPH